MLHKFTGATPWYKSDRGEVASWLVLMAGLAAAALLASSAMQGTIGDLASQVGAESGQAVAAGPAGEPGSGNPGGDSGGDDSSNTGPPDGGPGGDSPTGPPAPPADDDADDDAAADPPDPEISPWLEEALRQAGIDWTEWDPSAGVDGNREIVEDVYTYYGDVFLDDENMQWAGMANMIGPSFAAGFVDLDMFKDLSATMADVLAANPQLSAQFASLAADLTAEELQWYEAKFLDMQQQIFVDQAPAHEAYRQQGMDALDEMLATGEISQELYDSWELIDLGIQTENPDLVAAGNLELLEREQLLIIDDDYAEMLARPTGEAMTYLMTLIGQPSIPGAEGFAELYPIVVEGDVGIGPDDFCVFGACVDNPVDGSIEVTTPLPDGNIARYEDRWKLIIEDTLPAYQELLAAGGADDVVSTPVGDRIDDYRIDVEAILEILTNFEVDFNQ